MMTPPALLDDAALPAMNDGATGGTVNIVQLMMSAITHHWWKILAIWVILSAGLAYAVHIRIKPTYETFSLLRVEPAHHDLFGLGMDSAEVFHHFLITQVQLFTSPNVLLAAQSNRNVAATEIVKNAKDPESELRGRLQVFVVPDSYLIRIGMISPKPQEASVIVNEVVNAYLEVAGAWTADKNKYQINNLKSYNSDLSDKIKEKQNEWLQYAGNSNLELIEPSKSTPNNNPNLTDTKPDRVTVEEYRRVRQSLFEINMDLIESEAILHTRKAEPNAIAAGVDPEQLIQKRIEDTLRTDPEVAGLLQQIEAAQHLDEQAARRARSPGDPARANASRKVLALKEKLRDLCDRKRDELDVRFHEQGGGQVDTSLTELLAHIEGLRTRKFGLEKMLTTIEVTNRQQGTDSVKLALIMEERSSLKGMQESVHKRIEQLQFDSRGEARISRIALARPVGALVSDGRRKLWMMTPVGVLAMVLGLFLFLEFRSGRVSDLDEVSRRIPVEVYPVPSLPGTRRTSDDRTIRANELQLQEFLQSLDHLRVSLWFGKETTGGTGRCLAITSAIGGEGKTTLSAHLAVCCAKAGISTLVIDADLRRAALSRMFEEEQNRGLSDVLKGEMAPEEAVVALSEGGFHLLPAGSPGQHPGWLFREQRIGQVLARYRQMFDLVIIDTPPVLPVADALSLGRWVDGVIMVIRYDVSRYPLVERARKRLISAGIPILKTVVNGMKTSRFGSGYRYGYNYNSGTSAYGYDERSIATRSPETAGGEYGEQARASGPQESSSV